MEYRGNAALDPNIPIVGIASTPDGQGYIAVGRHGETYTFGTVTSRGNGGGPNINIVGVAVTADGQGYIEVGNHGETYHFGTVTPRGNGGGPNINIVGVAVTADGQGYIEAGNHGETYTFNVDYLGNPSGFAGTITGIALTPDGHGYGEVSSGGIVSLFGSANNAPGPIPDRNTSQPPDGSTTLATHATATSGPTLSIAPVADDDGDPLQYWFRVATNRDAETSQVINSGWLSAPSFTVPYGTLQDGVKYYWKVFTWDGTNTATPVYSSWPPVSLQANLRLGAQSVSPTDSAGDVSVGLASGNMFTSVSGPSFQTVGGPLSVGFSYNSRALPYGIRGAYYNNCDADAWPQAPGEPTLTRTDPGISFNNWGNGPPVSGISSDDFCVRWTGYITIPISADWCFTGLHDDGMRIWINGHLLSDSWFDQGASLPTVPFAYSDYCLPLFNDQVNQIQVDYYEHTGSAQMQLEAFSQYTNQTWQPVPATWLSSQPNTVPVGWSTTAGSATGLDYTRLRPAGQSVIGERPDGSTVSFAHTSNGGYQPEPGVTDVLTDAPGGYAMSTPDGMTYQFTSSGQISAVSGATDPGHPASAIYTYDPNTGFLKYITDPVSNTVADPPDRAITLLYSRQSSSAGSDNPCGPPATDFAQAPIGMLCQVNYWDGTQTRLDYYGDGTLGRIENPGGVQWDFEYTNGYMTSIRNPLANEAAAATKTDITYNAGGVATSVTEPAPTTGATRPHRTYAYDNGNRTRVLVDGTSQPQGWTRATVYDDAGHLLEDWDALSHDSASAVTRSTWTTGDQQTSTTDRAGNETTYAYDYANRQTDVYGPSASSCFGSDLKPNGTCPDSAIPHTNTEYDGGMQGLSARYWANNSFAGSPSGVGLAPGDGSGFRYSWGTGSPAGLPGDNWSDRYTGYITFPSAGQWTISVCGDDNVAVWFDDVAQVNHQSPGCGSFTADVLANSTHRIRYDHVELGGTAELSLSWTAPGGTAEFVPSQFLSPGFGLVTQTTTDDNTAGSPPTVATIQYEHPELGLPTQTIADPAGEHLITSTSYEAAGSGFFRPVAKTLPAGAATTVTSAYYGAAETADNPCTATVDPVNQGGAVKSTTSALAADGTKIVEQVVYDTVGRVVASRNTTDASWTCFTYDARGRILTKAVPAFEGQPASTYTYSYAVGGNPLVNSAGVTTGGTVATGINLLGDVTTYVDAFGDVTTYSYDQAGRLTDKATRGPDHVIVDVLHTYYDSDNRPAVQALNGKIVAVSTYDQASRLAVASYPGGAGRGGNNTLGGPFVYDRRSSITDMPWAGPGGSITRDQVAYSQSGRVVNETIDGVDANPASNNFVYDTAGRLTGATVAAHNLGYTFAASNTCGDDLSAGRNTNRTSMVDNGVTKSYCYDNTDRLTSTTDPSVGVLGYDTHGNTIRLGRQRMTYDGGDQHATTQLGTTTRIAYTRDATGRIMQRVEVDPATITQRALSSAITSTNTLTLPKPAAVVAGDRLIVQLSIQGTATATAPAGWSQIDNRVSGTSMRHVVLTKVASASEPANYTFTLSAATAASAGLAAYANVASVTLGTALAGASNSVPLAASVANDASLILGLYGTSGTAALTAPTGMTLRYQRASATATVAQADTPQALAGPTGTKTATLSAATGWVGNLVVLQPTVTVAVQRYGFTGDGDSPDLTLNLSNAVIERSIALPGGVTVTKRSNANPALDRWSYPNIHGDVTAVADGNGTKVGTTFRYDPFGNALVGLPDNSDGNYDYGWLGQHRRGLEHGGTSPTGTLATIEMGARQYVPTLGRFLEVDPIPGGCANDYSYVSGDPVNTSDLTGMRKCKKVWVTDYEFGASSTTPVRTSFRLSAKTKYRVTAQKPILAPYQPYSATATVTPYCSRTCVYSPSQIRRLKLGPVGLTHESSASWTQDRALNANIYVKLSDEGVDPYAHFKVQHQETRC